MAMHSATCLLLEMNLWLGDAFFFLFDLIFYRQLCISIIQPPLVRADLLTQLLRWQRAFVATVTAQAREEWSQETSSEEWGARITVREIQSAFGPKQNFEPSCIGKGLQEERADIEAYY